MRSPTRHINPLLLGLVAAGTASFSAAAQMEDAIAADPVAATLATITPEARRYHEHVTLLAHPALAGRLPGETGSSIAESVIIEIYKQLGLEPGFDDEGFRQKFTFRQGGRFGTRNEATIVDGYNTGAILPGAGNLADKWVVIGAHHDHIGMGSFGSRSGERRIHEGADDNASGTAAVLLAAELLVDMVMEGDPSEPRRSIFITTFSGEESGLNGSAHMAREMPVPLEDIAVMINVDMVGRIVQDALSINGTGTGTDLAEIVEEATEGTPLKINRPSGLTSRSDHAEFYRRGVPVLFFTETIFPDEYHTPSDESWLINVVDGAESARLIARTAMAVATTNKNIQHLEIDGFETGDGGPSLADIKIRFGIKPGNYGDTDPGVAIAGVSPDTSAEDAGLQAGDRLVSWNGEPVEGVREWMGMMAGHEPGDIVTVGIIRDGETIDVPVMLKPR